MNTIVTAVMVTVVVGCIGIILEAMIPLEGYWGIISSIAAMRSFILHSIEKNK